MRGKIILILLMTMSVLALTSSATLNITTMPDHDLWISALDPANPSQSVVIPMKFTSNEYGKLITSYEIDEDFTLTLKLKKGEQSILYEKFTEVYYPDSVIEIDFYPEGYTPVEIPVETPNETLNETSNETLNETNTTTEIIDSNSLEGNISTLTKEFSVMLSKLTFNKIYVNYSIIGIFALFLIILIVRKKALKTRIRHVNRKLKRSERNVERLKEKRKKLFIKIKENLIKGEEDLIKMRGGSIPEKEDKTPMLKRLQKALKNIGKK